MEVAFLADEWQDVVVGGESLYNQVVGLGVEMHREGVFFLLVERFVWRGLCDEKGFLFALAPIDGVDGYGVVVEKG